MSHTKVIAQAKIDMILTKIEAAQSLLGQACGEIASVGGMYEQWKQLSETRDMVNLNWNRISGRQILKAAREKTPLSQLTISRRLGYTSSQFISNWERGLATPPGPILKRYLKLIKVDPKIVICRMVGGYHAQLMAEFKGGG